MDRGGGLKSAILCGRLKWMTPMAFKNIQFNPLKYLGVDEWIVSVIKAKYEDASTKVRLNGRESRAFNVKVWMYQGSVLGPFV